MIKNFMSLIETKEKNLNILLNKLDNIAISYSQSSTSNQEIKLQRDNIIKEKNDIEKKYKNLIIEHKILTEKIAKMKQELNKKVLDNERFDEEIRDLNDETEDLIKDIEQWQT